MSDRDDLNHNLTMDGAAAPQPEATLSQGDTFAGQYGVERRLGVGGMGVVYLAKESVSGEEVALKLIHPSLTSPQSRQRMIDEGINARRISHPNVVRVFNVGESEGQVYLAMEYLKGRPLREFMAHHMASGTPVPMPAVLDIVEKVLSGLGAAHAAGIVHRDVKPENIMIDGEPGEPGFGLKILDFGIARGLATSALTGSHPVGTQLYMAPEQHTTPSAVGPSADIYSVGRMLYELLVDVLPEGTWNAPSEQRDDVPAAFDGVIRKALQGPKQRYQSAQEFWDAIRTAASDGHIEPAAVLPPAPEPAPPQPAPQPLPTSPAGPSSPTEPSSGKSKKLVLAAAAVVALVVVGGLFAMMEEDGGNGGFPEQVTPQPSIPQPEAPRPATPQPERQFVSPQPAEPEPAPAPRNLPGPSDTWYDEFGNTMRVTRDGGSFTGTGNFAGIGELSVRGALNGEAEVYDASGAPVGSLTGSTDGDPVNGHYNGTLLSYADGQMYQVYFHINHRPR